MVSQSQDAEWSDHPAVVRSGSMLSLDGRQHPQVARTPPSYYDAVRSRHSLSHPMGRPQESKMDKQYFPTQEKYNSLPRPLPQRYAVAMTNGQDKVSPPRAAWPGNLSPPSLNGLSGGWNNTSTDGMNGHPPRSLPPQEYRSLPTPVNPTSPAHLPSWPAIGHLPTGPYPGQYTHYEQPASPIYKNSMPLDESQHYGTNFGEVRGQPSSPQRPHPPSGPRQHPPPPIPTQQRIYPPVSPYATSPPANGNVEMRRPNGYQRDFDGSLQGSGRWVRRSYPSTPEDMSTQETPYYRSHSQELPNGPNHAYDPRYSRGGTLPARPRSYGSEIVLPEPAVSIRTGPLGTYPDSRPTHIDHLPPPSSSQPSSLPEIFNSSRERNEYKPRSPISEKDVLTKSNIERKMQQPQDGPTSLNEALLFHNGLPLRKSVSSSTASLCSEASSVSSRAWRAPNRINGDAPIKRMPLNSRSKASPNESTPLGKKEKESILSPSPWAREEKEKIQKRQVQDARRARDEEIEYLETLAGRTHKQEEILRILRLEREFQKRAEEVANGDDDDDEDEDDILDRAEHVERMLRMQEERNQSRNRHLGNSKEPHMMQTSTNSSDDWLLKRKLNHLSRIAEENGECSRDFLLTNDADVEQLSEFLDSFPVLSKISDSPTKGQSPSNTDFHKFSGQPECDTSFAYELNDMMNGHDSLHSFPVPAPRTSKNNCPPPVPPKSTKAPQETNGYEKSNKAFPLQDKFVDFDRENAMSYSKSDNISKSVNETPATAKWNSDVKPPGSCAAHNGINTHAGHHNGISAKTESVREVEIANLYASSKMRNGFVETNAELEKSPELKKLWTAKPEKLTFLDKIRKFSLQAGEEDVPKDKVKNSRAQREIETKFNEAQLKSTAQT